MATDALKDRIISLDVFRGLTVAGMVLVNNPGTWSAIYPPLAHAEWHGATPTDYIFPFFLFIVGVSISIALGRYAGNNPGKDVYFKIVSRSASIFAVGLIMSALPFFNFSATQIPFAFKLFAMLGLSAALFFYLLEKKMIALALAGGILLVVIGFWAFGYEVVPYNVQTMRIFGVLQRIAVCYLLASLLFLHSNWLQQVIICIELALIYWLVMVVIPVPGCEITTIADKACNLAAYVDRLILTENHIWRGGKVFDPEGILSTVPALVTTLAGVLTGSWISSQRQTMYKVGRMFLFGILLAGIGTIWDSIFPMNKSLWTSSYAVYMSGAALIILAGLYWVVDVKGYKRWSKPFIIFGLNAIVLFVFSGILARILGMVKVSVAADKEISLQQWIFETVFLPFASPINASLAFAVCFVLLWLFLMWLLYRRRIFIKL